MDTQIILVKHQVMIFRGLNFNIHWVCVGSGTKEGVQSEIISITFKKFVTKMMKQVSWKQEKWLYLHLTFINADVSAEQAWAHVPARGDEAVPGIHPLRSREHFQASDVVGGWGAWTEVFSGKLWCQVFSYQYPLLRTTGWRENLTAGWIHIIM